MCGISGIVRFDPRFEFTAAEPMHDALRHRGPDGEGNFQDADVCLSHRRLSIIDLDKGAQPLANEDGTIIVVANGEIYNFRELRRRLQSDGHRFTSGSDCEVIVHLYEQYGVKCVEHLRGMFAFALWDSKQRKLILARDRMGEKPLYLYQHHDGLVFSSEIRSLLASGIVPFELDPDAVQLYFHFGYVPEPRTPLRDVTKLDAASVMTVNVPHRTTTTQRYWDFTEANQLEGDPVALLRGQLSEVGELITQSDVPVGIALSGGLDSSLVAALASKSCSQPLSAFSVGYPGMPPYDERGDARELANHLGIPLHEIEITADEMASEFVESVDARDDPIANISGYAFQMLMRRAKEENVPVMLQGQGGDELFWGYPWVRQSAQQSLRKQRLVRPTLSSLPTYVNPVTNGVPAKKLTSLKRVFRAMKNGFRDFQRDRESPDDQLVFYDLTPDFRSAEVIYPRVRTSNQTTTMRPQDLFRDSGAGTSTELQIMDLVCRTYLRVDGIALADRLSMASSVEVRLPLVDHRLVETVVGIQKRQTQHARPPKALLREAVSDLLPDWVMSRPKRGFQPPMRQWYQMIFENHGRALPDGFLVDKEILSREGAEELSRGEIQNGTVHPMCFKALVLELWCQGARRAATQQRPPASAAA